MPTEEVVVAVLEALGKFVVVEEEEAVFAVMLLVAL